MAKNYTVMWICEIMAEDEAEAAVIARQTIAHAPYSYFDVYDPKSGEAPVQVEVGNDSRFTDLVNAYPYYPMGPKSNNN